MTSPSVEASPRVGYRNVPVCPSVAEIFRPYDVEQQRRCGLAVGGDHTKRGFGTPSTGRSGVGEAAAALLRSKHRRRAGMRERLVPLGPLSGSDDGA